MEISRDKDFYPTHSHKPIIKLNSTILPSHLIQELESVSLISEGPRHCLLFFFLPKATYFLSPNIFVMGPRVSPLVFVDDGPRLTFLLRATRCAMQGHTHSAISYAPTLCSCPENMTLCICTLANVYSKHFQIFEETLLNDIAN